MKRMEFSVLLAFLLALFVFGFTGFAEDCSQVRESTVRLHILANSDSPEDQALKLKVRDRVLEVSTDLFTQVHTKEEARQRIQESLAFLEQTAQEELTRQGSSCTATAEMVEMYFDTRQYDSFVLPAGMYDAVRIKIGAAEGKNWWCVLFPPLCVPAAWEQIEEDPILQQSVEQIQELSMQYVPKFALVEWAEKWISSHD